MSATAEILEAARALAQREGRYVYVCDGETSFRFDSFAREVIEFSPAGVRRDVSVFSFRGPTRNVTIGPGTWTGD